MIDVGLAVAGTGGGTEGADAHEDAEQRYLAPGQRVEGGEYHVRRTGAGDGVPLPVVPLRKVLLEKGHDESVRPAS